jgi:hypothetical protein
MKRLVVLLAIIGGAVYLGSIKVPLRFLSNSAAIRTVAEDVLQPLESNRAATDESVQKALDQLRSRSGAPGNRPLNAREVQALALLAQAEEERKAVLERIKGGSSRNPLDTIPGDWHVIGKPHQKVDPSAMNDQRRNAFWASTEQNRWRQRCDYYRSSINALLAPAASLGEVSKSL